MKSLEHAEQVNLMQWWSLQCRRFGIHEQLLFAIPNGGQRNIITAKRMKDEGVRSGIPDLFLAVPRGNFHGLFIEMKKPRGGVVSENQKACMEMLSANGYCVTVCHGFIEAKTAITAYLDSCLVDKKCTHL
jgi:hypothetical protein